MGQEDGDNRGMAIAAGCGQGCVARLIPPVDVQIRVTPENLLHPFHVAILSGPEKRRGSREGNQERQGTLPA